MITTTVITKDKMDSQSSYSTSNSSNSSSNNDDIILNIDDILNGSDLDNTYKDIVCDVLNDICNHTITTQNICSYVVYLMKIIDTYPELQNDDKKKIVIFILKKVIELNVFDNTELSLLNDVVDKTIPNLIDTFILIDNKEIVIKTRNYVKSLWDKILDGIVCGSKLSS